jgi:outer membrane protein
LLHFPALWTIFTLDAHMKKISLSLIAGLMALGSLTANANSLLEIYQLALENDAQLKADEAAYQGGLQNRTIGRAGLLPQVNATAFYNTAENNVEDRSTNESSSLEQDSSGWEISLSQPLFNMSAWYSYRQGVKLSELAEAQFGADQQSLIVRVADAYFNVLRAIDNLETALAEENALSHQLDQTKQRYEVGLTAITEVHEAQSVYDTATAATFEARGNLGIAYEALEVLTGQPHDRIAPLAENFPVVNPAPADRHEWVDFALKNNYELKAVRLNAEAARQSARASSSEHLPTLSGSASYSEGRNEGSQFFGQAVDINTRTDGHSFGIRLDVPLFSGGRTSGLRRQAASRHMQAQEEANRVQRSVIQSTRALHLSVETGVARVHARQQAIVSTQSALEATQSGYEVGTRNLVEVLLAQRAVYEARRNYANALYDYVIDTIQLRQAAGMLTPADVQEVDRWLQASAPASRSQYE